MRLLNIGAFIGSQELSFIHSVDKNVCNRSIACSEDNSKQEIFVEGIMLFRIVERCSRNKCKWYGEINIFISATVPRTTCSCL